MLTSFEVPLNVRFSESSDTVSVPESPAMFSVATASMNERVPEPSVART